MAFTAIPIWNAFYPSLDCDAQVYFNAIHSVHLGHDPYAEGVAAASLFRGQMALHPNATPPYFYLYSPITLPVLQLLGCFPAVLYISGYWLIYAAGVLAAIFVSVKFTEPGERSFFLFLAPAAAFFPGFFQEATVMDGNIAFILYGLVFVCALLGWRRGRWHWFYLAVLAASCFKIPMLSLLAIPLLSARKQWLPVCVTGAAGLSLFAMQLWIWPVYFHNYLRAIAFEFSLGHAFGVSPAGLSGFALFNAGLPYSNAGAAVYIVFALPLFALLLYLSRQFHMGHFSLEQWVPVMMMGVILLNPRVLENDFAPLTLFMAMTLWRVIASLTSAKRAVVLSFLFVAVMNIAAAMITFIDVTGLYLNCIEGLVLLAIFAAGCWNLLRQTLRPATETVPLPIELAVLEPV
jgi:hypothetical protein